MVVVGCGYIVSLCVGDECGNQLAVRVALYSGLSPHSLTPSSFISLSHRQFVAW